MSGSNIARAGMLLLAALCLPGGATQAAVSSPFVAMAGSWSGGGVLSTTDGMQERLRCRASYDVAASGAELRLGQSVADDARRPTNRVYPPAGNQRSGGFDRAQSALTAS